MEYIEKIGQKYYARVGAVEIDQVKYFDSRVNYNGWGGRIVKIPIGDFELEWHSNFGFGSWSGGSCHVVFKGIFVRLHPKILTTEQYVNILNKYASIDSFEKDIILLELANMLAYYRKELDRDVTIIGKCSYDSPNMNLENILNVGDKSNLDKLIKIIEENKTLKKENARLNGMLNKIQEVFAGSEENET
jgi:hypothetical protein